MELGAWVAGELARSRWPGCWVLVEVAEDMRRRGTAEGQAAVVESLCSKQGFANVW